MRIQEPVINKELVKQIKKELKLNEDIISFLVGRGYDKDTIDLLTNNEYEDMTDDYMLTNIKEVSDIVWDYLNNDTDIYIFNDYDSDGINAGYILYDCLSRLVLLQESECKVNMHTPDRCEGYGLNMEFCKDLVINKNRDTLVITVDNGITKKEECTYLKSNGIEVIITDHHKPQDEFIPENTLIIDAHLYDTDNENALGLCGAAVAYKLCKYILKDKLNDTEFHQIYIPYVAIATITDMMPITNENIIYVKNGLYLLNDEEYKSMFNTVDEETNILNYYNEFKGYKITPKDIAFEFGPQLNSCGRMGDVSKAMDLMLETDGDRIVDMYNEVCDINEQRKALTNNAVEQILETVEDNPISVIRLVKNIQGVAGNVATHITNVKHVPTILFTDNEEQITGSARSIAGLDLQYIFSTINTKLEMSFGGHELAAGVTIYKKDLNTFVELFNSVVLDMILSIQSSEEITEPIMLVDKILSVKDLGDRIINKYDNILYFNDLSEPIFCLKDVYIKDVRESKNNKNNIQFFFKDKTGENKKGIWCWKYGNSYKEAGSPTKVNLVFTLNKFNNMLCMDIKYMEPVD